MGENELLAKIKELNNSKVHEFYSQIVKIEARNGLLKEENANVKKIISKLDDDIEVLEDSISSALTKGELPLELEELMKRRKV
jgi:SMC interacting uncharacterized protein involved in chromosome segregation